MDIVTKKIAFILIGLLALWGLVCYAQAAASAEEAQTYLGDPPENPAGELTAERVQFTSGKVYKVYRGPGKAYGQAGNGKAAVSTNDWIEVFGREGDWVMIQYEIASDHMRIGWIEAKALPRGADVPELVWRNEPVSIPENFSLTDDPLFSQAECAEVRGDSTMAWLGTMDQWAYVEAEVKDKPVRGFIALDRLSVSRDTAILRMRNTLLDKYDHGYTEDELAEFILEAAPNDLNGWTATATHRHHASWRYEMIFDDVGGCCGTYAPFKVEGVSWFNEGAARSVLRQAGENHWFGAWNEASRKALLDAMAAEWIEVSPTAALQTGSLTAEEAVRELFVSYFGPEDGWTQAVAEWCEEETERLPDENG